MRARRDEDGIGFGGIRSNEREVIRPNEILPDGRRRVVEAASGVLLCVVLENQTSLHIVQRRDFSREEGAGDSPRRSASGGQRNIGKGCRTGLDIGELDDIRPGVRIRSGIRRAVSEQQFARRSVRLECEISRCSARVDYHGDFRSSSRRGRKRERSKRIRRRSNASDITHVIFNLVHCIAPFRGRLFENSTKNGCASSASTTWPSSMQAARAAASCASASGGRTAWHVNTHDIKQAARSDSDLLSAIEDIISKKS